MTAVADPPIAPATTPAPSRGVLYRLGWNMHERRRLVAIAWVVGIIAIFGANAAIGSAYSTQFEAPGESRTGFDLLQKHFRGAGSGTDGNVVFQAPQGIDDPKVKAGITAYVEAAGKIPHLKVGSPYAPGNEQRQIARQGPFAGKIAFATLGLTENVPQEEGIAAGKTLRRLVAEKIDPVAPGVRVEIGGQNFAGFKPPSSETLGIAFAIVILIVSFGSVLAMGLPIGTAIAGIGVGLTIAGLMSNVISIPGFASSLGAMIGLGVGIDYALFIVSRYREETHSGASSAEATANALDTAGRAVLFAGITVVISLLGMLTMGLAFVNGLAISAASVVAVTLVASVTLLPALLGFAGHRLEVTRWRGLVAAGCVAFGLVLLGFKINAGAVMFPVAGLVVLAGFFVPVLKKQVPHRAQKPVERTFAHRWSRQVQAHPVVMVVASLIALLVLAIPVLSLRMGFSDEGNFPKDTTTRKAYDLLADGFGPGFNGPLLVIAELPNDTTPAELATVTAALGQDKAKVAAVIGPITNAVPVPGGPPASAVLWNVVLTSAPQDAETTDAVRYLRGTALTSPAVQATGIKPAITGFTTVGIDFSDYMSARLPLFFGSVLFLSFLLLMAVFRSLLVPLKAVFMNMLSIGAAYGLCTAVFQWGWGKQLLGIEKAPIEPFMPMMLFAILFGLSMDYEVFLLSRVKEEYDRTKDNARAVADGLAATARLITAAAAIMVVVFGSFLLETDRTIKLFGLGLASAIFLDATIVRMVLVPATMELLGDRNWWLPAWLGKIIPKIDVEGSHVETEPAPA